MLAVVTASSAGDTTVVAAVAGKKIRVKSVQLVNQVATAQSVKLRTGTTDLHAAVALPLAVGPALTMGATGADFLVETVAGALLAINLSAATAVTGLIVYSLE